MSGFRVLNRYLVPPRKIKLVTGLQAGLGNWGSIPGAGKEFPLALWLTQSPKGRVSFLRER